MAARSARDALRAYVTPLQRAIACFAPNRVLVTGSFDPELDVYALALANDELLELRDASGRMRVAVVVTFYYRQVPSEGAARRWMIHAAGYVYQLEEPAVPARQIVTYHWHPWVPGISFPHLHVLDAPAPTRRLHLPTGHITLKDVLALAVRDFGVQAARPGWERVLDEAAAVQWGSMDWASVPSRPVPAAPPVPNTPGTTASGRRRHQ